MSFSLPDDQRFSALSASIIPLEAATLILTIGLLASVWNGACLLPGGTRFRTPVGGPHDVNIAMFKYNLLSIVINTLKVCAFVPLSNWMDVPLMVTVGLFLCNV